MNRLQQLFAKKKNNILSVYFTAGYPKLNDTVEIIKTLSDEGIDLIEIGIPFSDPMADGPVIQRSSQRALENGITQKLLFEQLKNIRKITDIPLILMGYLNPAMQFGFENLCKTAAEIGIDGLIIPDIPIEEYESDYRAIVEKYGLAFIPLITPETSDERIRHIDDITEGFIYMVSSASTTGVQASFAGGKEDYFRRIQAMKLKNPTLIGFGISNKETFDTACRYAQGAIIGSAFINALNETESIGEAVKSLKKKIQ
ncbi:MAG: tryptophan synthase subunit alpha [Prevotellaceae bacterium]|jgi:tryptophan synthase alpha chain|nr:tryptophan synthase subunit alpha [Prevotellaceae bacterium]